MIRSDAHAATPLAARLALPLAALAFALGCSTGTQDDIQDAASSPARTETPSGTDTPTGTDTPATMKDSETSAADDTPAADQRTVRVRVFDADGELVGPLEVPAVEKTRAEWLAELGPERFKILRAEGTERPFCGTLLDNKLEGVYTCGGCGLPLFSSASKFDSGTGWPSFFQPVAAENITEHQDFKLRVPRTEIECTRCGGHLGHAFPDGPAPTGLRYCLNSEALEFTEATDLARLADPAAAQ